MGWRKTPAQRAADKKAKTDAKVAKFKKDLAAAQKKVKAEQAAKKKADRVAAQREKREQRKRNQGK